MTSHPETLAWTRLAAADHGVLGTTHPHRGVDLVPVVFACVDRVLGVPVDRVKAKRSHRLQRERNLEADPRATLLIENWSRSDWTRLWWVRASLRWDAKPADLVVEALAAQLARRFVQYADRPFERILVFRVEAVLGWSDQPGGATVAAAASLEASAEASS